MSNACWYVLGAVALSASPVSVLAQGGVNGGGAAWLPAIPLSPAAQANGVQVSYAAGLEFVTVNAPGNAPWTGTIPGTTSNPGFGRGSVDHSFAISRFETPTALWVQFFNDWYATSQATGPIPFVQTPSAWGAQVGGGGPGNHWGVVSGREMMPVGGISWRTAAIFCNWMSNGQQRTRQAFLSGAYDVSTFGWDPNNPNRFTDQPVASPGAAFRLPTLDEWMQAGHYDPNGNGAGQGRWWWSPITSDALPIYGPAALGGQANAGSGQGGYDPFAVMLGAYPSSQSPWGLLDMAGGTSEWTESIYTSPFSGINDRFVDGSGWTTGISTDYVSIFGGDNPSVPDLTYGVRLVWNVPSPSGAWPLGLCGCVCVSRRARR